MTWKILQGDAVARLQELPAESVHCCVTSPPYWGLRDYGVDGQIGLEPTPAEWCTRLVEVFREVRRVLRSDGTLWLNCGDAYAGSWGNQGRKETRGTQRPINGKMLQPVHDGRYPDHGSNTGKIPQDTDLKPKDLIGAPWMLAFALRADGWFLRGDYIWSKPNPMPESVTDRCTKSHEYVFHLSKGLRYFWDQEAVKERAEYGVPNSPQSIKSPHDQGFTRRAPVIAEDSKDLPTARHERHRSTICGGQPLEAEPSGMRNLRSVWMIATEPFSKAHFATFPTELVRRCILAGTSAKGCCQECGAPWARIVERKREFHREQRINGRVRYQGRESDGRDHGRATLHTKTTGWQATCSCLPADPIPATVLDPFGGSGTTGLVAEALDRDSILIELSPEYAAMAEDRIREGKLPKKFKESLREMEQSSLPTEPPITDEVAWLEWALSA